MNFEPLPTPASISGGTAKENLEFFEGQAKALVKIITENRKYNKGKTTEAMKEYFGDHDLYKKAIVHAKEFIKNTLK